MPTFEELTETLADENASSYSLQRVVRELGRLGDERAIEPLISALGSEDRYVRREAAKSLGELGSPAAVEPLIEALGDSEEYVRRNAITALGILGDERAIEPLKQSLEDKSYLTRSEAEKSLRAIEERLETVTPAEDVEEQEQEPEPEPEPEPVSIPPVEPEVVEESSPAQEISVDEEPETPPDLTVTDKPMMVTKELPDTQREALRERIFEHHTEQAKRIAREIDQQQSSQPSMVSSTPAFSKIRICMTIVVVAAILASKLGIRFIYLFPFLGLAALIGAVVWSKKQEKS
ncbi:HEAT repeat domain-containing protein [Candidatus Poribacteria bacterium]